MYALAVALIVALHFAFIGYVVLGGFLALRWRRTLWLHAPAVLWGAAIATNRLDCPLTGAERWARRKAGSAPLPQEGFIAHYVTGTLYPAGWLVGVQLTAFALIAVSWAVSWALYFRRLRAATRDADDGP